MSIGENIRYLRKKNGLTQRSLAEKTGLNEVTIRSYELGKYRPKIENVRKISEALDVYISDLVDDWRSFPREELIKDMDNLPFDRQLDAYVMQDELSGLLANLASDKNKSSAEIVKAFKGLAQKDGLSEAIRALSETMGTVAAGEKEILSAYNELNEVGQMEAVKRVEELTEIPKYQKQEALNAAHERTDIELTEEMKKHDDNIMDDENF